MPLYTFYPFAAGGFAPTFVCADLPNDLAALKLGARVGSSHPSAVRILVLQDGRHVGHLPGPAAHASVVETLQAVARSRARLSASLDLLQRTAEAHRPYGA